jgi:hypothetical protein
MSSSNGTPIEHLTRRVLRHFVTIREQMEIEGHDNKQVQKRLRIAAKYERLQIAIAHSIAPPSLLTQHPPTTDSENDSPQTNAVHQSDREESVAESAGTKLSPTVPQYEKDTLPSQTCSADGSSDDAEDSNGRRCSDDGASHDSMPRTFKRNYPIFTTKATHTGNSIFPHKLRIFISRVFVILTLPFT